jgi:S-adenosyl-L-methionine methyltransferase
MSRLDSFIRRMVAARACLDHAARLIAELDGPVFEFGLGNGRTYDHLREILPRRDIFVFEKIVSAHPDCIPPSDRLIHGDVMETLPRLLPRFAESAALAHLDLATHDPVASQRFLGEVAPLMMPLLRRGAIVVSGPPIDRTDLARVALPEGADNGRYFMYRVQ